jgi:hypothetical protein
MASFGSLACRSAVAGLLLAGAASALANVLVVRSLGSAARSYPAGRSLPDSASVTLAAGDTIVLLGARGTRTLRGPGTYRVSGPAQSTPFADLLRERPVRARVGAVRGSGGQSRNVWQVDPRRGGTYCIAAGANPTLWRAEALAAAAVTLSRVDSPDSRALEWQAGQHVLSWPTEIALEPGVDYEIHAGLEPAVRVRFVPLAGNLTGRQDLAAALIENGCHEQLDRLIESTPEG